MAMTRPSTSPTAGGKSLTHRYPVADLTSPRPPALSAPGDSWALTPRGALPGPPSARGQGRQTPASASCLAEFMHILTRPSQLSGRRSMAVTGKGTNLRRDTWRAAVPGGQGRAWSTDGLWEEHAQWPPVRGDRDRHAASQQTWPHSQTSKQLKLLEGAPKSITQIQTAVIIQTIAAMLWLVSSALYSLGQTVERASSS